MSLLKEDWRDRWGYYHTTQPCRVCGSTEKIGLEPRYGYAVCKTHSTVAPADMPVIDYKKILLAYMNHVGDIEGTVFLGRSADDGIKGLNDAELAHLRELSKGKTEPCPLCKYDHGHMIGCKNNPVDIALRKT